jgi:hypothetical protein
MLNRGRFRNASALLCRLSALTPNRSQPHQKRRRRLHVYPGAVAGAGKTEELLRGSIINRLLRLSAQMNIHLVLRSEDE